MERTIKNYINTLYEFDSIWGQDTIYYKNDNNEIVLRYYTRYSSVEIEWELIPIHVTEEEYFNVYNFIRKYTIALYNGKTNKK